MTKRLLSILLLLCLAASLLPSGVLAAAEPLPAVTGEPPVRIREADGLPNASGSGELYEYRSYDEPRSVDAFTGWKLVTMDGGARTLDGFTSPWLALVFGRTGCYYCNETTSLLMAAVNGGKQLEVVFLCAESTDYDTAAAFAEKYPGVEVSTTYAENSSKMWAMLRECGMAEDGSIYLPGFCLLDEERNVRFASTGPCEEHLEPVLAELPGNGGTQPVGFRSSGLASVAKLSKAEIVALLNANPTDMPSKIFDAAPSNTAPYAPGKVNKALLQRTVDRLNALRVMAGLNPVMLDDELCAAAQYGAVLLGASDFSHRPDQPEDMDDDFYQKGVDATSTSNIFAGWPLLRTPDGFMDDSDASNVDRVGHRRWQLNPEMGKIGFGYTVTDTRYRTYTAEKVFDRSASDNDYDFISWPPSGAFPSDTDAFTRNTAWSVSLNPDSYQAPVLSSLTVYIRRESDGKEWTLSGSASYTQASSGRYLNVNNVGFGVPRCIIFRPDDIGYYDGLYTVTIDGLKDRMGQAVDFSFQVDFFDSSEYVPEPEIPVLKGASAGAEGITVTWNPVAGATKYKIYRKTGSGGWTGLADVTGTSYLDTAVTGGTTYTYTVKAYVGGWTGFDSKGVSAAAKEVFGTPVLKSAAAGSDGITVTWNAVAGATKYKVYRKTGSGGWTALADVTGTSFLDTAVTGGTTYTYTVKAYHGTKWSGFDTKGVSATAKDTFGAPVLKSASAGTNGITLTWNAVSGATQYRVYRKTGSGGWVGLKDVTGTSYTDADVTSGTTYTYTVKAYNGTAWSSFDAGGISATAK